jgi:hypothetical protein
MLALNMPCVGEGISHLLTSCVRLASRAALVHVVGGIGIGLTIENNLPPLI